MNASRLHRLAGIASCLACTSVALIGASGASALTVKMPPAPSPASLSSMAPTKKPAPSALPAFPQFKRQTRDSLAKHRVMARTSSVCEWHLSWYKQIEVMNPYGNVWGVYSEYCGVCYRSLDAAGQCLGKTGPATLYSLETYDHRTLGFYCEFVDGVGWYHWNGYQWVRM